MNYWTVGTVLLALLLSVGCKKEPRSEEGGAATQAVLQLRSPAFPPGEMIPARHSCDGRNVSPPLAWEGAPAGTSSLALIMDDPDAPRGTFTHWLVANIGPRRTGLSENASAAPGEAVQGKSSFGRAGYGGPCPPAGETHRYFFKLYALDEKLALSSGFSKDALLAAMEGHVLAAGELMGRYRRQ